MTFFFFVEVESLAGNTVVSVSCGTANTATITNQGHVYTWGSNSNGQLGYPFDEYTGNPSPILVSTLKDESKTFNSAAFTVIDFSLAILNIAVGDKHMAAVSSHGDIWTWGNNDYEQLGREGYLFYLFCLFVILSIDGTAMCLQK